MAKIVMQHTLNYIYKTDASKLDNIMGKGHDKRNIGEDDHYYVIQDTIVEEDNTTEKNVAVCKPTTFKIIKQ
jgi:hypothetical protein